MAGGNNVIAGLGSTGLSYARYLRSRGESFIVLDQAVSDSRRQALEEIAPGTVIGNLTIQAISGADTVYVSPGVPLSHPALEAAASRGAELKGDVQMFGELADAPLVVVTGTNGKSTVSELFAAIAGDQIKNVSLAGNIGTPCLDVLDEEAELYVLEASSYQLELACSLRSKVALVLNLSPDHLDRYPDAESYYATKLAIYDHCESAVVNRALNLSLPENLPTATFGTDQVGGTGHFGLVPGGGGYLLVHGDQPLVHESEISLSGTHNLTNVLAALATGWLLEFDMDRMIESVLAFRGLAHRSEFIAELNGVRYINDSKGTNPGALIAAVRGCADGRNVHLIAGGVSKDADFSSLQSEISPYVKTVNLIGESSEQLQQALPGLETRRCDSLDEAVAAADRVAEAGDVVLLSPGCASFDQFRHYAERGDKFRALVAGLSP